MSTCICDDDTPCRVLAAGSCHVTFNERLELAPFCTEAYCASGGDAAYELYAVIVHAYRGDAMKGPLLDFDRAPSTIVDIQRSPATTEARLLEITAFAIDEHAMVRQTDGVGGMVGIGDRLGFSRRCTSTCPTSSAASRHCCSPCELPRYGMCTWRWRRRRGKGLGMLQNSMRMPTIKLLRLVLSFVNAVADV